MNIKQLSGIYIIKYLIARSVHDIFDDVYKGLGMSVSILLRNVLFSSRNNLQ